MCRLSIHIIIFISTPIEIADNNNHDANNNKILSNFIFYCYT